MNTVNVVVIFLIAAVVNGHYDLHSPDTEEAPPCCDALTASCMACHLGVTVEEFCAIYPDFEGCTAKLGASEPTRPTIDGEPKLCISDADCASNEICEWIMGRGVCTPMSDVEPALGESPKLGSSKEIGCGDVVPFSFCLFDSNCDKGFVCKRWGISIQGACTKQCLGSSSTAKLGASVLQAEPKYCDWDSDCAFNEDCVWDIGAKHGVCTPEDSAGLGASEPTRPTIHGEPKTCISDSDCASNEICLSTLPPTDHGVCTLNNSAKIGASEPTRPTIHGEPKYCDSDADCELGYSCAWKTASWGVCEPNDGSLGASPAPFYCRNTRDCNPNGPADMDCDLETHTCYSVLSPSAAPQLGASKRWDDCVFANHCPRDTFCNRENGQCTPCDCPIGTSCDRETGQCELNQKLGASGPTGEGSLVAPSHDGDLGKMTCNLAWCSIHWFIPECCHALKPDGMF